jgi:hypothetical protein
MGEREREIDREVVKFEKLGDKVGNASKREKTKKERETQERYKKRKRLLKSLRFLRSRLGPILGMFCLGMGLPDRTGGAAIPWS